MSNLGFSGLDDSLVFPEFSDNFCDEDLEELMEEDMNMLMMLGGKEQYPDAGTSKGDVGDADLLGKGKAIRADDRLLAIVPLIKSASHEDVCSDSGIPPNGMPTQMNDAVETDAEVKIPPKKKAKK
ncbi:hypothetical protein ABZP36_032796 [Zizania latifolia]